MMINLKLRCNHGSQSEILIMAKQIYFIISTFLWPMANPFYDQEISILIQMFSDEI